MRIRLFQSFHKIVRFLMNRLFDSLVTAIELDAGRNVAKDLLALRVADKCCNLIDRQIL